MAVRAQIINQIPGGDLILIPGQRSHPYAWNSLSSPEVLEAVELPPRGRTTDATVRRRGVPPATGPAASGPSEPSEAVGASLRPPGAWWTNPIEGGRQARGARSQPSFHGPSTPCRNNRVRTHDPHDSRCFAELGLAPQAKPNFGVALHRVAHAASSVAGAGNSWAAPWSCAMPGTTPFTPAQAVHPFQSRLRLCQ